MTPDRYLTLVAAIDRLYEQVVMNPASFAGPEFADWASETLAPLGADKKIAREMRRGLRTAQKLQTYWSLRDEGGPADWKSRVDECLGTRAWEPGLAIVQIGLERAPDPALFDEVKRRISEVRFDRWMEGVDYEEWLEQRDGA